MLTCKADKRLGLWVLTENSKVKPSYDLTTCLCLIDIVYVQTLNCQRENFRLLFHFKLSLKKVLVNFRLKLIGHVVHVSKALKSSAFQ